LKAAPWWACPAAGRARKTLGRFASLLAKLHIVHGGGHMLLTQLDDIIASVTPPGR
jgi:hypothetical protein